jgi:hypothetical protein
MPMSPLRAGRSVFLMIAVFLWFLLPALANSNDEGKLKIHVQPKQAYVFIDNEAIRDGSQTIQLSPGAHEVSIRNYGYAPHTQSVNIEAGKTTDLNVDLQKSGDKVSGPFGYIEFKGHPRAAVLLNGTTPDYFVGHVDEFDGNWIWHQRLLVKPGSYNITVTRKGNPIWSGPVSVKEGERVTVDLNHDGRMKTSPWREGDTMAAQPRFHAGVASATVPIAPVSAQLTAQSTSLNCGQSTQLDWKSADAIAVSITNLGNVSASGDRPVTPTKSTTYELVAKGPGGEATQTASVNVNAQPTASLNLSTQEVHYHKVGDKVVQDDPVMLNWSASNANQVTITPLGTETVSGTQTITPQPTQTSFGPVDQVVNYTLSASNPCGGTTTQTAALHFVGSIDPAPPVVLASVFYPSNYPQAKHANIGLVATEKAALTDAANHFKEHEQYASDHATLMVVGYADVRGPKSYNLQLGERRARLVKDYLAAQGIPADKIQIQAEGKKKELSASQVSDLQRKDSQKPEKWMTRKSRATWLAYNRRVDIILEPTGQESMQAFPNDASDARLLWQRAEPSLRKVESAAKSSNATATLYSMPQGN